MQWSHSSSFLSFLHFSECFSWWISCDFILLFGHHTNRLNGICGCITEVTLKFSAGGGQMYNAMWCCRQWLDCSSANVWKQSLISSPLCREERSLMPLHLLMPLETSDNKNSCCRIYCSRIILHVKTFLFLDAEATYWLQYFILLFAQNDIASACNTLPCPV